MSALVARAERWLIEPVADGALARPREREPWCSPRPIVAVVGLAPRCGATTVARAVAVELAGRDAGGVAVVTAAAAPRAAMLATGAARRLARRTHDGARAAGRLCLVPDDPPEVRALAERRAAPLVLDVPHGVAPEPALALSEHVVLVVADASEPALASVVLASLDRAGRRPSIVANRVEEGDGRWDGIAAVKIAETRLGAGLAAAGRAPVAALSDPIAELCDRLGIER